MSPETVSSQLDYELLLALGINLGLAILFFWFVILFLMLRELRKFTAQFKAKELGEEERKEYQAQLELAIHDANDNSETLTALMQIQQALESQMSAIQDSPAAQSDQDLVIIDDLNHKLSKSKLLIKKLKNDLDSSVNKLRKAKVILLEKDDTVESLRQQKEEIEKQFEHLEREYIMISENGGLQSSAPDFRQEKQRLLETIEDYKHQLAAQPGAAAAEEAKELKQQLLTLQKQMQHQIKEKEFIEKRYLELAEKDGKPD